MNIIDRSSQAGRSRNLTNFLIHVTQINISDNCLSCIRQSIWNANIFAILMYLLLYNSSFCCFSSSGDPHRIVLGNMKEKNAH